MKLNNYDKLSIYAIISLLPKENYICCQTHDNIKDLILELQQRIGPSLRKSEISKISLYAKVHSATFEQHYIPEIYMSGFEKKNFEMIKPNQLYQIIKDKLDTLKEQADQYVNTSYIQSFGIFYEDQ